MAGRRARDGKTCAVSSFDFGDETIVENENFDLGIR